MIVMHIDVNSAFLSWTAAYEQQQGIDRDIRKVASVIGGNEQNRHGIVLARSILAKKFKIQTGMSLMEARRQCPNLLVVPPDYQVYVRASKTLREYLYKFTPDVEVFSIDECFLRFTDLNKEEALSLACKIKEDVKNIFGYTINIGISKNKLLAKMAGNFEKPDKCHTCFPEEIKEKLWPLPVEDLFMVGRKTKVKLNRWGIYTIGDLAKTDPNLLFKSIGVYGHMIYAYANGIDGSIFKATPPIKSVGNSSTLKFDVIDTEIAHAIILSLVEMTAWRLREAEMMCKVVSVGIKDKDFNYISRQKKLPYFTDCTKDIYKNICALFDKNWDSRPIRQLGVSVSGLEFAKFQQLSMLKDKNLLKNEKLDKVIDSIREKYGDTAVIRGIFANSELSPILGGYPDDEYPGMSSIL
ncbi:MAG: DNA polymerase IV [Tissierellia bacterium]|nr:DNA polymerase IV [Tissierellia bacterium]